MKKKETGAPQKNLEESPAGQAPPESVVAPAREETASAPPGEASEPVPETVTVNRRAWEETVRQAEESGRHRERMLHLAADFDNYRKRTDKEKERLAVYAQSQVISRLLPVLDTLEQAFHTTTRHGKHPGRDDGLLLIFNELLKTLRELGLEPLEVLNRPYSHEFAEAVEVTEQAGAAENEVVAVLRTGYRFRDLVLRPALVRINRGKQPSAADTGDEETDRPGAGQD